MHVAMIQALTPCNLACTTATCCTSQTETNSYSPRKRRRRARAATSFLSTKTILPENPEIILARLGHIYTTTPWTEFEDRQDVWYHWIYISFMWSNTCKSKPPSRWISKAAWSYINIYCISWTSFLYTHSCAQILWAPSFGSMTKEFVQYTVHVRMGESTHPTTVCDNICVITAIN